MNKLNFIEKIFLSFRKKLFNEILPQLDFELKNSLLNPSYDFLSIVDYYSTYLGQLFSHSLFWLDTRIMPVRKEILNLLIEKNDFFVILKEDITDVDITPFVERALIRPTGVKIIIYKKKNIYRVDCLQYPTESQKRYIF